MSKKPVKIVTIGGGSSYIIELIVKRKKLLNIN